MNDLSLFRLRHAEDHFGKCGFAGPALSHKPHDLAVADIEIHVVEDLLVFASAEKPGCAVAAAHMADFEDERMVF